MFCLLIYILKFYLNLIVCVLHKKNTINTMQQNKELTMNTSNTMRSPQLVTT